MDLLTEILAPARPTAIVDVGANPIDGDPPYHAMLAAGLCEVTGFEPQPDPLARLEKAKGPRERYLPYALGDGSAQQCTSAAFRGNWLRNGGDLGNFRFGKGRRDGARF